MTPLERHGLGRLTLPLLMAGIVVVLDQLTKHLVRTWLPLHARRPILDGIVALVHGRNPGIGFSVLATHPRPYQWAVLSVLTAILAAALVLYLYRLPARPASPRLALALILGGAVGNLIDRIRLGYVTDFVRVGWHGHLWPDFNLADSAITIGTVLLVVASWGSDKRNGGRG
jgi:signal peptidase II